MSRTIETYHYVDSKAIIGHNPTIHIPRSANIRIEWLLDQFISDRAGMERMRNFEAIVRFEKYSLVVAIDIICVYWLRVEAEDGSWLEPREIVPMWTTAYLYNEEGEKLPHDFDINQIINNLKYKI